MHQAAVQVLLYCTFTSSLVPLGIVEGQHCSREPSTMQSQLATHLDFQQEVNTVCRNW